MNNRLKAYFIAVGVLIIVALALYTSVANEYTIDSNAFQRSFGLYLVSFALLEVTSVVIFLALTRKDSGNVGMYGAKSFALMYISIILYALFTRNQYRLSANLFEEEIRMLNLILFIAGIISSWFLSILVAKAFKHYARRQESGGVH